MLTGTSDPIRVLRSAPISTALSFLEAAISLVIIALLLRDSLKLGRSSDARRFLAFTSLSLGTLFLFPPSEVLGMTGPDSRLMHLSLAIGLGALGITRRRVVTLLGLVFMMILRFQLVQF